MAKSSAIVVGSRYVISPDFFHSKKRAEVLTREVYVHAQVDLDDGYKTYIIEELVNGPRTPAMPSGFLWLAGDIKDISPMSWTYELVNETDYVHPDNRME